MSISKLRTQKPTKTKIGSILLHVVHYVPKALLHYDPADDCTKGAMSGNGIKTKVESKTTLDRLRLDEVLDTRKPSQILPLLLHVNVIWYEDSQRSVDSSLFQIPLQ